MKKLLFIVIVFSIATGAFAQHWGRGTRIETKDLPETSQKFISKYFNLAEVSSAIEYSDNYSVQMNGEHKLNFYKDGSLKEAEGKSKALPKDILHEFPEKVRVHIMSKYGLWELVEVEVKRSKIEIELENGNQEAKLVFDRAGQLLKEKIDN